ncbi:unnamed protein product, partial [Effrenium voratum]
VHEQDLVNEYDLLKEYLLAFAASALPGVEDHKAAMVVVAVTMNLFVDELYKRKGGKGKVKDIELHASIELVNIWANTF